MSHMLFQILKDGWYEFYELIKNKPDIEKLDNQLDKCYSTVEKKDELITTILEPQQKKDVLKCLQLTSIKNLKVVILGNKPISNSNGLSFGSYTTSKEFTKIKEELEQEFDQTCLENSDEFTNRIASQGVLLLDVHPTSLMHGKSNFHSDLWTVFIEELIKYIYNRGYVVWLIWSQVGLKLIRSVTGAEKDNGGNKKNDNDKRNVPTNILLKCSYPSQTKKINSSANKEVIYTKKFEGCNHFILCNHYLKQMFMEPIQWLNVDE